MQSVITKKKNHHYHKTVIVEFVTAMSCMLNKLIPMLSKLFFYVVVLHLKQKKDFVPAMMTSEHEAHGLTPVMAGVF